MRDPHEVRKHLGNITLIAENVRASLGTEQKAQLDQVVMRWCLGESPPEYLTVVERAAALAERIRKAMAARNN